MVMTEDGAVGGRLPVPRRMPRGSNEVGQGHAYGADCTNITGAALPVSIGMPPPAQRWVLVFSAGLANHLSHLWEAR
jgi:hypothetical protein